MGRKGIDPFYGENTLILSGGLFTSVRRFPALLGKEGKHRFTFAGARGLFAPGIKRTKETACQKWMNIF